MAETDGTPRFRKSKPPKGAHGNTGAGGKGRNASNRNTRPNGKARKRAALNATLPTGAVLDVKPEESEAAVAVLDDKAGLGNAETAGTDVIKTMPTMIGSLPHAQAQTDAQPQPNANASETQAQVVAEPVSFALDDTHVEQGSSGPRPKLQRGPNPAMLRSKRPLLSSTLRMELTVRRSEGSEPEISVRPSPSWSDSEGTVEGVSAEADAGTALEDGNAGATTPQSQAGAARSRKLTAPGGYASFPDIPARGMRLDEHADDASYEARRGGAEQAAAARPLPALDANTGMHAPRPRRPRRPGERTLIMTRRDKKRSSKRDWMFVVMLVAALGLTASMVLSRQAPGDEVVDASAYDDAQAPADDEQQPDTFTTTLQPYKAKPAAPAEEPKSATQTQTQTQTAQAAQTESSISASSIQATELRSLPSGAEVVAGDAVVGSTPVRVARGSLEMTYTLRMPGHSPKVVRVGPQSPPSIMVELTRIVSGVSPSAGSSLPGTQLGHLPTVASEPAGNVPPAAAPKP